MEVNILGIAGPHRKGRRNTVYMVEYALEVAKGLGDVKTKFISLRNRKIEHCKECNECVDKNLQGCTIQDDMEDIYKEILAADGIILGTPVHTLGLSARIKTMMDRCRWMAYQGLLRWKVATGITVAYMPIAGQEIAIRDISSFVRSCQMIESGLMYGGVGVTGPSVGGHIPWEEDGKTKLTPVENDKYGLKTAAIAGRMVAETAKVIKTGRAFFDDKELGKLVSSFWTLPEI